MIFNHQSINYDYGFLQPQEPESRLISKQGNAVEAAAVQVDPVRVFCSLFCAPLHPDYDDNYDDNNDDVDDNDNDNGDDYC